MHGHDAHHQQAQRTQLWGNRGGRLHSDGRRQSCRTGFGVQAAPGTQAGGTRAPPDLPTGGTTRRNPTEGKIPWPHSTPTARGIVRCVLSAPSGRRGCELPYQDAGILQSQRQPQQPRADVPLQEVDQGLVPPGVGEMPRSPRGRSHAPRARRRSPRCCPGAKRCSVMLGQTHTRSRPYRPNPAGTGTDWR